MVRFGFSALGYRDVNQQKRKSLASPSSTTITTPVVTDEDTGMLVPRARLEPNDDEANGAALAVYRGHLSPQCPVWSVAFFSIRLLL